MTRPSRSSIPFLKIFAITLMISVVAIIGIISYAVIGVSIGIIPMRINSVNATYTNYENDQIIEFNHDNIITVSHNGKDIKTPIKDMGNNTLLFSIDNIEYRLTLIPDSNNVQLENTTTKETYVLTRSGNNKN